MEQMSLSIGDVCALTGLGKTKLYEHINSGELKARKLGKRTLILKADLEDFLNGLQSYGSKDVKAQHHAKTQ